MVTKVRIQTSSNGNYNFLSIQILSQKYKDSCVMDVMGFITFQQNIGENNYYGMRFSIDSDKIYCIEYMLKLAKTIKKEMNFYDVDINELLTIIKAEKYFVFDYDFIAEKDKGSFKYKVMDNDNHSLNLIALNDIEANKKLTKLNKIRRLQLVLGEKKLIQ